MDNSLNIKEVIQMFLHVTLPSIKSESEVPGINLIFNKEGINLLEDVKNNPYIKNNYTPIIDNNDIYELNKINPKFLSIKVNNPYLFFALMRDICYYQALLENYYGYKSLAYKKINLILKRIWLRAGILDLENIEMFLQKQLDFIKDYTFENSNLLNYTFMNYDVIANTLINNTYCETSRKLKITLESNEISHQLPSVLYDIRCENDEEVCYIYAIQNEYNRNINKKIERNLYKLNSSSGGKGVVHPNFVSSLLIFIDILNNNEINHIKVPLYQVLSYDYHVLLTKFTIDNFNRKWNSYELDNIELYKYYVINKYNNLMKEYEHDKIWYSNTVNKEELISKNKTENLSNLILHLEKENVLNINYIQDDDTMDISLRKSLK